jgi:2-phosphoglycerate kinase
MESWSPGFWWESRSFLYPFLTLMHHMKGWLDALIICLEGASAAGKTTLSHAIAARTRAAVVAEVWALFERPSPEPPMW